MIMGDMVLRGRAGHPLAQALSIVCMCNAQDHFRYHQFITMIVLVCVYICKYIYTYSHYIADLSVLNLYM